MLFIPSPVFSQHSHFTFRDENASTGCCNFDLYSGIEMAVQNGLAIELH